jgi:hypothetical protein
LSVTGFLRFAMKKCCRKASSFNYLFFVVETLTKKWKNRAFFG